MSCKEILSQKGVLGRQTEDSGPQSVGRKDSTRWPKRWVVNLYVLVRRESGRGGGELQWRWNIKSTTQENNRSNKLSRLREGENHRKQMLYRSVSQQELLL